MRFQPYQLVFVFVGLFWAGLLLALMLLHGPTHAPEYAPFQAPL